MTRKEDEEQGWFLIEDFNPEELKEKEIIFNAKDLADWFSDFDRWWLQKKDTKVCVSHEGFSYEPYFFGKIGKIEEFKSISLDYFEKNKNTISDKEADIWDFMATANIERMTYKDGHEDVIQIKLNSLSFRSPLD